MTHPRSLCATSLLLCLLACSDESTEPPNDLVGPAAVTDLAVSVLDDTEAMLTWTAPGDDVRAGRATAYDLRYALGAITDSTWASATPLEGLPSPAEAGAHESFAVSGLPRHQWVYFALRTADEVHNWSALSNQPRGAAGLVRLAISGPDFQAAAHPRWSPDGQRIAFDALYLEFNGEISRRVFVVDANGGTPVLLGGDLYSANSPAWSSDGSTVAFVGYRSAHATDPTGYARDYTAGAPTRYLFSHLWPSPFHLDWARTFNLIAFSGGWGARAGVFTVDIDATEATLIFQDSLDNVDASRNPRFSPDATSIAFESRRGADPIPHLWRVPTAGGEATRITNGTDTEVTPAWSPDGRYVAYSSGSSPHNNLWRVNADGSDPVQLTFGGAGDREPDWSPDGRRIVFASKGSGKTELWIMTLDE